MYIAPDSAIVVIRSSRVFCSSEGFDAPFSSGEDADFEDD